MTIKSFLYAWLFYFTGRKPFKLFLFSFSNWQFSPVLFNRANKAVEPGEVRSVAASSIDSACTPHVRCGFITWKPLLLPLHRCAQGAVIFNFLSRLCSTCITDTSSHKVSLRLQYFSPPGPLHVRVRFCYTHMQSSERLCKKTRCRSCWLHYFASVCLWCCPRCTRCCLPWLLRWLWLGEARGPPEAPMLTPQWSLLLCSPCLQNTGMDSQTLVDDLSPKKTTVLKVSPSGGRRSGFAAAALINAAWHYPRRPRTGAIPGFGASCD